MPGVVRTTQVKSEPTKMSTTLMALVCLLLPVSLAFLVGGCLGMSVLMDPDNESDLSKTYLAQQYKRLIQINPFFSAAFVNGGLIGLLFCLIRLHSHSQAVKLEKTEKSKKKKE